jgi:outer membrane protein OmpA-like peptidoglycan-associated protein
LAEVTEVSAEVRAAPAPAPAAAAQKMTLPVAVAPKATQVAAVDPTTTGTTAAKTAAAEPGCALDQLYNVIGFNENSNDLTPKLTARLDQILADIGDNSCVVQVIGYSSTVGDYATNALFAVERAQNVLTYMKANGLHVAKATATGAGETEQFGADPVKNRRVVITVTP